MRGALLRGFRRRSATAGVRLAYKPKSQSPPRISRLGFLKAVIFRRWLSERLVRRRVREVSPKRIPETEEPTQRNGRLLTHLINPRAHDYE
jgi:hypothetical protein